jgi:hypothetical protein
LNRLDTVTLVLPAILFMQINVPIYGTSVYIEDLTNLPIALASVNKNRHKLRRLRWGRTVAAHASGNRR